MTFDRVSRMPEEAIPAVRVVAQTTISSQSRRWRWEGAINHKFTFKQPCKKEECVPYCRRYRKLKY
jgi:hypothetical protein